MSDVDDRAPVTARQSIEESADAAVAAFGYKQELHRSLRFFSLFAVAFSVISISTGLFLNYGFGSTHSARPSSGRGPSRVVGQLLMALIIAELSTKIPLAGYAYQWGARLVNSALRLVRRRLRAALHD